jgi:hypothetical protein
MVLEYIYNLNNRLKTYKKILLVSFIVFVSITIWQGQYAVNIHESDQK